MESVQESRRNVCHPTASLVLKIYQLTQSRSLETPLIIESFFMDLNYYLLFAGWQIYQEEVLFVPI